MTTNAASLLVDLLVDRGVDRIFGFPGDTSLAFYDALGRSDGRLVHVLARDERHAAFMADAYSRTTGRIGVCEASSGAGAVYLASGLAEALTSRVPLLAITTDNNRASAGTSPISEMDQSALFAACTVWHRVVTDAGELADSVAEAWAAATTGRVGPVALIIAEDILDADVADVADVAAEPARAGRRPPSAGPGADGAAVRRAAELLDQAARPVIVCGGGLHRSRAWPRLRDLAEHAAVPVATTIHGKGALDEQHALALGVVGGNGSRPYANDHVARADVVLFVGTRANATDTASFTVPPRDGTVGVVQVDLDADRAGGNYPGTIALVGDAGVVLDQLREAVRPAGPAVLTARTTEIGTARRIWRDRPPPPLFGGGVLHPQHVVAELQRAFGREVWITADAGTPTPYLAAFWESSGEGNRVLIPRGHGPMGYALPAAVGVAEGHPGEPVVCVTTENSLAMSVAELETIRRLALPVTVVVLDNTSLAWIKMLQHLYVGARYFAVDPGPIDPVGLGTAMGVPSARATDAASLAQLLGRAASQRSACLVHVCVPEHTEAVPPVPAWSAALSATSSGSAPARPIH